MPLYEYQYIAEFCFENNNILAASKLRIKYLFSVVMGASYVRNFNGIVSLYTIYFSLNNKYLFLIVKA